MKFRLKDDLVHISLGSNLRLRGYAIGTYSYKLDRIDIVKSHEAISWYRRINQEIIKKKCREFYEQERMNEALE